METFVEVSDIDKYGRTFLNDLVEEAKQFNRGDEIEARILSGDPDEVRKRCSFGGSIELADRLSKSINEEVVVSMTNFKGTLDVFSIDHIYLSIPSKDIILDATAGQFIPKSSRVGYEKYFLGNMFIGPRKALKEMSIRGVVNTPNDPQNPSLPFKKIWGDKSLLKRSSEAFIRFR